MPKNNSKANRERRRIEAQQRQEQRDRRTPDIQLAVLDEAPRLVAAKERARLQAQIDQK